MYNDTLHHLLPVYLAYIIAVASPGPSTMAIMTVAMREGRSAAIALAFGVITGSIFWGIAAAFGLSALLAASEMLWIIKYAGGCYLIYLGVKSAKSAVNAPEHVSHSLKSGNWRRMYLRGALLHLTNPKAILGWGAILSLGLKPNMPDFALPALLIGCAGLAAFICLGYAVIFSTPAFSHFYMRIRRALEATLAVVFTGAGLRLLLWRP
ncbi:LysE family translocator [Rhodobacteraceae bacterium]|nr:LysE family translocator [Paracoccaceae bacterium]